MPTALSIYKSALGRLGLSFEDGLLGEGNPDSVLAALNAGLDEMSVDHDWQFNYKEGEIRTAGNVDAYDPPSDWLRTAWIVDAYGRPLVFKQRQDHLYRQLTGPPAVFDTAGDKIYVAPVPDREYVLRHGYYATVDQIELDTEEGAGTLYEQLADIDVDLPSPFDTLATLYVARAQALVLKDRELYGMLKEEISDYRRKMEDNRRRHQAPGRTRTRIDTY